jgi:hypothetical protein
MCQHEGVQGSASSSPRNVVTEKTPLSEKELLHEIDMRVGAKLVQRDIEKWQYQQGVKDCVYVLFILACAAYILYVSFWNREE